MAEALMDSHNISVYSRERVTKMSNLFTITLETRAQVVERQVERPLTAAEQTEAQLVFGNSLNFDQIKLAEDPILGAGGYARALPRTIYFPPGSFGSSNFMPWLIHELTHSWQYQHGVSLFTTIYHALEADYDYGGEVGLRGAIVSGKKFVEFTTEEQGDILGDYYVRLKSGADVSAWQPFVAEVRGKMPTLGGEGGEVEVEEVETEEVEAEEELYIPGEMARRYGALSPEARAKVNEEVDRRFRKETGVTRKLDWNNPADRPLARRWLRIRDEVMAEREGTPAGAIHTMKVWLNAFIPREVGTLTQKVPEGPFAGKTMIPGPIPGISDCFLTDNRDFDPSINASSRMHSEIKIDVTSDKPREVFQWHKCYPTHEIDCEDGDKECTREGDTSRMKFSNPRGSVASLIQVDLVAASSNPCFSGSPDIDYLGNIIIDTPSRKVELSGRIDEFPAFEMYATANDGAGVKMFRTPPLPGKTPWNLVGGAKREQKGEAKL
jgi:hypothetical protein